MKFALLAVSLVTISFSAIASSSFEQSITAEVAKDLKGIPSCFNGKLKNSGKFEEGYTMVETEVVSKSSSSSVCDTVYDIDMNQNEYGVPSFMGCKRDESVKTYVTITDVQTFGTLTFDVTAVTTFDEIITTNSADMNHVSEVVKSKAVKSSFACKSL